MNRRSKTARLLTGGLIGASTTPLPGDEHWDDVTLLLDGSSLTDDLSTAGNNTADEGATLVQVTGPYNSTQNVLNFDATGSSSSSGNYIETGVSADFKFGTSPFTIEMWLKPDVTNTGSQTNSLATILDYGWYDTGSTTGAWFALHQVNSELSFVIDNGNSTTTTSSSGLSTTNWAHVAIVRNATNTLNIYVDGVSKASGSFNFNLSDTLSRPLSIGYQPGQARHYDGQIADLRITKGVARYTSNFTPPTQKFLPFAARPYSGTFGLGDEHWNDVTLLLDGSTASLTTDASTAGNDPTNSNVTSTTATITGWSEASDVFSFDGSDDYLTLPSNFAPQLGTGDFTVECWLNASNTTGTKAIFDCRVGSGNTSGWVLYLNGTSLIHSENSGFNLTATSAVTSSTWHHVALVRSSNTTTLFVDGSSVGTVDVTNKSYDFANPLTIGQVSYSGSSVGDFAGNIADIRITKGVARYTADFTPPTASLPTNAPVVGRRGVGTEATLRTRGYVGAAPAGGGMLTLYDRYVRLLTSVATGGTETDINVGGQDYRVHVFNSSGTFTVNTALTDVEYLVIGGGGGGGSGSGGPGGGGAGGYLEGTLASLSVGNQTITVGAGGAGASTIGYRGSSGGNSSFGSITATGGGGGGGRNQAAGDPGGSGGGGADYNNSSNTAGAAGGLGVGGQGYNGGSGNYYDGSSLGGGGGGGAGAAGTNGSTVGGGGGAGKASSITGTSVTRAGGGGGTGTGANPIAGGSGGGGASAVINTNSPGSDGTANTGSGGGGGTIYLDGSYQAAKGGDGGSGVVIIRYKI